MFTEYIEKFRFLFHVITLESVGGTVSERINDLRRNRQNRKHWCLNTL